MIGTKDPAPRRSYDTLTRVVAVSEFFGAYLEETLIVVVTDGVYVSSNLICRHSAI